MTYKNQGLYYTKNHKEEGANKKEKLREGFGNLLTSVGTSVLATAVIKKCKQTMFFPSQNQLIVMWRLKIKTAYVCKNVSSNYYKMKHAHNIPTASS